VQFPLLYLLQLNEYRGIQFRLTVHKDKRQAIFASFTVAISTQQRTDLRRLIQSLQSLSRANRVLLKCW